MALIITRKNIKLISISCRHLSLLLDTMVCNMILDVNSIFIRYSITINSFFNKFSKLTQNTKINAIFVHVKTTY